MVGVVIISLLCVAIGAVIENIWKGKETGFTQSWLTGFFFLFCLQGALFFVAQMMHLSFRLAVYVFWAIMLLLGGICLILQRKSIGKIGVWKDLFLKQDKKLQWLKIAAFIGFLGLLIRIFAHSYEAPLDLLVETARTSLQTNTMNQVHPLTGRELELGMILSRKLVTLPFFYGSIGLFSLEKITVVVRIYGTILTMLSSLFLSIKYAKWLFPGREEGQWVFVVLWECFFLSSDWFSLISGYNLLQAGYTGEAICMLVLLPEILWNIGQFCQRKHTQTDTTGVIPKCFRMLLCLGASLFLAPLYKGFIILGIAAVLGTLAALMYRKGGKQSC